MSASTPLVSVCTRTSCLDSAVGFLCGRTLRTLYVVDAGTLHIALLVGAAITTSVLIGYAWRHRDQPGALSFTGAMCGVTFWTLTEILALTQTGATHLFWERVQWAAIAAVPLFFFLFMAEFTGRESLLSRRIVSLLFVVPAVTVALVWTNPAHHLVWVEHEPVRTAGMVTLSLDFGPWFWVYFLFAYTLLVAGFVMLLRLVVVSEYFYLDQTVLVVVGILAPLTGNALSVFELAPLPGLDLTPVGFTVTAIAFGNAFLRYRLFDILPATRQLSTQAALAAVDDGVVIVGDGREILYLNDAAADILGCDPQERFGDPVETVLSTEELDFESADALAELGIGERTCEVTTAPITDQRDRLIGHTILLYDVTSRVRREQELRRQRNELVRLDQLNRVIRNVNGALVSATTREEVVYGICETLVTDGPYESVRLGLGSAPGGDLVAMSADDDAPQRLDPDEGLPAQDGGMVDPAADGSQPPSTTERGAWVTVPLVHRRTVYGMFALQSGREEGFVERERDVFGELGETIGHAIHAVEQRQLLVADAATELEFRSTDPGAVLVSLSEAAGQVTLDGLVPGEEGALLAYLTVDDADPETVTAAATDSAGVSEVRPIDENGSVTVEVSLTGGSLCCPLVEYGANVRSAEAADGICRVVAEVSPEADVRTVVERVTEAHAGTELVSKRDLTPAEGGERGLPSEGFEDLTERQRETLEAAYRAGYFEWPRDSTAEEVAGSLGVSSPTLHSHLRKAEGRIFSEFFDRE